MSEDVSGNENPPLNERQVDQLMELEKWATEPLHPDLEAWVEERGPLGAPMLRHPLVYAMFLSLPGQANRVYARKKELLAEAQAAGDWHTVVFLHERPYRFEALVEHVTGRFEDDGSVVSLGSVIRQEQDQDTLDLVADVWVDSENIPQHIEDWRALFGPDPSNTFFLGTYSEQQAFKELPDPIPAYRAGIDDGDWSWTTKKSIAEFFARRFQDPPLPVMEALIPKADCFGYLTRRGENELLVRLDPDREVSVSRNEKTDDA